MPTYAAGAVARLTVIEARVFVNAEFWNVMAAERAELGPLTWRDLAAQLMATVGWTEGVVPGPFPPPPHPLKMREAKIVKNNATNVRTDTVPE